MSGVIQDQTAVIDLLASPASHGGAAVERIDTHAAIVFLAGDRAWKLKRAVRFDYLDFSTEALRRRSCEAELRLNRRTAPALYLRVVPVTRSTDDTLAIDGDGTPVDWVLEMRRFPQECLFDRLASAGKLERAWMPALAGAIAGLHRQADQRLDHGGRSGMAWVIDGNAAGLTEFGAGWLDADAGRRVTTAAHVALDRWTSLLDERRAGGWVRQCHGDLHLRNIVLLEGRPTPFDAVEFNDEIACIDVLYDLAFLLMDLWRRDLRPHANVLWNSYLAEIGTFDGIGLLPLFLSCRAAIRAKTSATAAHMQDGDARRIEMQGLAREYLDRAETFLHPAGARLVAVGGLSGSGKSTLALGLAPSVGSVPGAVALRSDTIRKRLAGVGVLERLGPEGYASDVSQRVYETLAGEARLVLDQGHSVIVDAVYADPDHRLAIARVAEEVGVPFTGLWLEAPEAVLVERVSKRTHDASDADAGVVRRQLAAPPHDVRWHHVDASLPPGAVLDRALKSLPDISMP